MAQEDAMEEADLSEVVRPGGEKDWPKQMGSLYGTGKRQGSVAQSAVNSQLGRCSWGKCSQGDAGCGLSSWGY